MSLYNTLKEAQVHLREMFGLPITLRDKQKTVQPPKKEPPKEEPK